MKQRGRGRKRGDGQEGSARQGRGAEAGSRGQSGHPRDQTEFGGQPSVEGSGPGAYGTSGGGQGYGGGGYGYPTGGYGTGAYGSAASQQGYGGRGFVDENEMHGSQYGTPGSYGARDEGGRQGWGAGGYRDQGMGLSVQGYGSTGYGSGGREANAAWGWGGTQEGRPEYRPEPHQRFGEAGQSQAGREQRGRRQWRAPQGYERSDQRIYEDACDRLGEHPYVDPRSMSVKVEHGVVTLEGTVATRQEKHVAEDVVDAVPGVKDVDNRLRVGHVEPYHGKEEIAGLPEGSHMISRSSRGDELPPERTTEGEHAPAPARRKRAGGRKKSRK